MPPFRLCRARRQYLIIDIRWCQSCEPRQRAVCDHPCRPLRGLWPSCCLRWRCYLCLTHEAPAAACGERRASPQWLIRAHRWCIRAGRRGYVRLCRCTIARCGARDAAAHTAGCLRRRHCCASCSVASSPGQQGTVAACKGGTLSARDDAVSSERRRSKLHGHKYSLRAAQRRSKVRFFTGSPQRIWSGQSGLVF